ncbi:L-lactate dehydrogenase [Fodinisporobacter ferrooxydans]|uniref:L-lactate dehydrogenase n=1 Tax=Fodinisporobacter ferrooxydans TaxID=2901836 RepID=A0ABY4CHM9_9BACL|nr:L-lactate dehydrogenase [Alicyclobacillaceae bacterium MYW30-H2]
MAKGSSKIVLIGNGAVGSTFAYTVLLKGLANELVIIDVNQNKAEGDVLDLNHGLLLASPMKITAGCFADCANADIIVVTAGAAQKEGETRLALMNRNVKIFESIIRQVVQYNTDGILLIATNPVDILTQVALKLSEWPKQRVFGSGTLLDSSRFRYLVAEKFGVDPRSVHGMIIGEHGDSEVALWSSLYIAGVGVNQRQPGSPWHLTDEQKNEIYNETRMAAYKIIEKKGATYYAIALALARICEAILKDQKSILPVSSYLENYHGIDGVCLGVPSIVGRNGVEQVIPMALTIEEEQNLQQSATTLKKFLHEIGF